MFGKTRDVLGVDIGSHSVKITEVGVVKGELMVRHGTQIPIPPEEPDYDVAPQIRAYLDSQRCKTRRVVTSLSASSSESGETDSVVWQLLERPEIPMDVKRKDLLAAMELELEDFVPYDAMEAVFDCEVLYPSSNGRGSMIILVVAHRELIEQRYDLLRRAALEPVAIELDFFALERLAEYTGQLSSERQALLMDIGASKSAVGFYRGTRLQAIFDFDAGGQNITAELQRNQQVDYHEAEEAKQTRVWIEQQASKPDEEPDSFIEAISALGPESGYLGSPGSWQVDPAVENAIDDHRIGICPPLRACLDSYETDFPDAQISSMVLAGGTGQLYNFPELLMERIGVQTQKISYVDRFLWPADNGPVRTIQANEPTFAVAVGLAMKKLPYKKPKAVEFTVEDENMEVEND